MTPIPTCHITGFAEDLPPDTNNRSLAVHTTLNSPNVESSLNQTSLSSALANNLFDLQAASTFQRFVDTLALSNFNAAHNLRRVVAMHTFPEGYANFIAQSNDLPLPPFISSLSSSFRRLLHLKSIYGTVDNSLSVSSFFDWLRPSYRIEVKSNLPHNGTLALRIHRTVNTEFAQNSTLSVESQGPRCSDKSDDDELQRWLLAGLPGLPFTECRSPLDGVGTTGNSVEKPDHICARGGFTRKSSEKFTGRRHRVNTGNDSSTDDNQSYSLELFSGGSKSTYQPLNNNGVQFLLQIASALRRSNTGDLRQHVTDVLNTALGRFRNDAGSLDMNNLDSIAERCHQLDQTIMSLDFIYMTNCVLLWNKVSRSVSFLYLLFNI